VRLSNAPVIRQTISRFVNVVVFLSTIVAAALER